MATTSRDVIVQIYSHSYSNPIPSADYKYDLRRISNPPREMRRQFNGRAKRLRDHMLHNADFSSLLEQAVTAIDGACSLESARIYGHEDTQPMDGNAAEADPASRNAKISHAEPEEPASETEPGVEAPLALPDTVANGLGFLPVNGEEVPLSEAVASMDETVLTVSCFCIQGKHRSVAFAEELAKRLSRWQVELHHRDIDKKPQKHPRRKDWRIRMENGLDDSEGESFP